MSFVAFSRAQVALVALLAALLVVVTVVLPSTRWFAIPTRPHIQEELHEGIVQRVVAEQVTRGGRDDVITQVIDIELADAVVRINHTRTTLDAGIGAVQPGDKVLVNRTEGPDGEVYLLTDYVRQTPLWALTLAFVALVLVVGRFTGLWSLVGMAASLLVITRFIVTGILAGHDPVLISCAGAFVIILPTLYLSHGVSMKTTAALAGVLLALLLTAVLSVVAIDIAHLSGTASEEANVVRSMTAGAITTEGLLLAGIIIGALGVLDDVTMSQASTVFELRAANPRLGLLELYRRGMNVGRDHIASTVNTLVFAYAGASLPLLLLLVTSAQPFGTLLNREFLATEIVRTLVGSIGIVAAVPLTTLLAAAAASRQPKVSAAPLPADR